MPVPGGWIRFNPELGRGDAHCSAHPGCKADRVLNGGGLGFLLSWAKLALDPAIDKEMHMLNKEIISGPGGFPQRLQARQWLRNRAHELGAASLESQFSVLETRCREGVSDEPETIRCLSIMRRIGEAAVATADQHALDRAAAS